MLITSPTETAYSFDAADESLLITSNGAINSPSGSQVIFGSNQYGYDAVTNNGTISGDVGLSGNYDSLVNSLTGTMTAIGYSVVMFGDHTSLVNEGTLSAPGASPGFGIDATGASTSIFNSGSMYFAQTGILERGTGGSIVNSGTIASSGIAIDAGPFQSSYDPDLGSAVNLTIGNSGVIRGDVDFGSGANRFDGVGGTLDGNLVGGTGVDTFDLSHQTVTGLISGGAGDDVITGTAGNDIIDGGTGADHLDGGLGINTATYQDATAGVSVDLLFNGSGHGAGDALGDTLVNFENLTGSAFADTLEGDGGNNVLDGGAGNDLLYGRGGNDTVDGGAGNDIIYAGVGNGHYEGGDGSDLISFANLGFGVTISLAQQGAGAQTLGASTILIDGFENISGSAFADTLTGDGNANTISGGAGDDHINGGLGNDTILGGTGNDILTGGGGTDTVSYADATAGVTVSLAKTVQQNTVGSGLDTISGFANLTGSAFADTLTGTTGDNVFAGLGGKDVITGGGGHDTFTISAAPGAANLTTVTDFSPTDDIFALNRAVFGALPAGSILANGAFHIGATADSAAERILYDSATGNIFYDADGNGAGAAVEIAHVGAGLAVTASDFHIYG